MSVRSEWKQKKKALLYGIVAFGILIPSAWKIYQVNVAFPPAEKVYVEVGEEYQTEEDLMLSVSSMELLDKQQLKERYGDYIVLVEEFDYKGVIATVNVKNISTESKTIELYRYYIETDKYLSDGLDMDMYILENQSSSVITLLGGEERRVYLPYCIRENRVSEKNWRNMEFYLVSEWYPKKVYWKINIPDL